ncbi:membrane protein insertion efficiency factor YidD [Candidatus Poribacteria bacterium]|nr:membrane protein insertion efficiency factor YidD [Candidatus Poribacteria bacterium]
MEKINTDNDYTISEEILTGSIRFYQSFISTQDSAVCNFQPSCSHFGIAAIHHIGILKGILLTSDRLQRCNGMNIDRYSMDHTTGKLIDPIEFYSLLLP